ncbi:MAG TPA: hypothetical protein VLL08_20775 [Kineosporiaceae bacterium]|nr:hypothetical protein [Kineosporiaceae bacterium]
MSATADLSTDAGDTSAHVLWPADPQEEPAGQLRIDLDDGHTWSGCPVTVEARVTISGPDDVQAVFRVQGLEATWCPPPQVVSVSPTAPTRLFVELRPAAGTPPGRYLWSLTAEVAGRPMLATTAQLHVARPKPAAPPPPPRSRRRPIMVLVVLVTVLLATLAALTIWAPSRVFWGRDTTAPKPAPTPSQVTPTARPSTEHPALTEMVLVKGTVSAEQGKDPVLITAVRLNLNDLTGTKPRPTSPSASASPEAPGIEKHVHGKHWSLSLPPGLYGLTFSKPGHVSESIVVATAVSGTVPRPHVRLDQIAPNPTAG